MIEVKSHIQEMFPIPKTWKEKFEKIDEFPEFNFQKFYEEIGNNIAREKEVMINTIYGAYATNGTYSERIC